MNIRYLYILIIIILFAVQPCTAQTYTLNSGLSGTKVNTCSGTFYDSGGASQRYNNNEDYTVTFCSNNGGRIRFNFSSWDVESHASCSYDYLRIYDGSNTSAPLIGTYCTNSPGVITSTDTCLHFVFHSDFIVRRDGWTASISCLAPLGEICTYRDEFNSVSYSNSHGTESWTSNAWQETGDSNGPNGASTCCNPSYRIYVAQSGNYGYNACPNLNNCLYFDLFASSNNDFVSRKVDLSVYTTATVSYDYNGDYFNGSDQVNFQVRKNGGSWNTLKTYSNNNSGSESGININSYIASDTEVRFIATTASYGDFAIDNFQISVACGVEESPKRVWINPFVTVRLDRS